MGSKKSSEFSRQSFFFETSACKDSFSILECHSLESASGNDSNPAHGYLAACSAYYSALGVFQKSVLTDQINDVAASPKSKRQKIKNGGKDPASASASASVKMSHITVERNRRKLLNERLSVLRSLMPRFYIKKSDKASIIGGVVNYIHELQQILRSLESKKKSNASGPKLPPVLLPISPSTSRSSSPYNPRLHQQPFTSPIELSPSDITSTSSTDVDNTVNEFVATAKSVVAEVEVKFSGPNLLLKTTSRRIPGQAVRLISALEQLELEILDASISTGDKTIIYSFTIKIGVECQLSAEELAHQIQRTFCYI